jgi:hypothetical protein
MSGSALIGTNGTAYTLTNQSTIQGYGTIGSSTSPLSAKTSLSNSGMVDANSSGHTLMIAGTTGTVTNNGTFEASAGGTLNVTEALTNFAHGGNTLSGGAYIVDGTRGASTMNLSVGNGLGGEIVNNAASITLDGANANVSFLDANNHPLLSNFASNSTTGSSLTIENGYILTTPGNFSNVGSVVVGSGSTFKMGATGGNILTNTTTGILSGGGTIQGSVTNNGTVTASDPGSPDILTITGGYEQTPGSILEAYLGGTNPGTGYSQLIVNGLATLDAGATLDVTLVNGFSPTPVENFYLLESDQLVSGTFLPADLNLPTLPAGEFWEVLYNTTCGNSYQGCVDLRIETPEPSVFLLLAMGLAAMTILLRYRNTVRSEVE